MMSAALRYWETVRHLKPVQIYGRLIFRLVKPRPDLRAAPRRREMQPGGWRAPVPRPGSYRPPDNFEFLGIERRLADHGWDDPGLEALWRYNLHYFDDLAAADSHSRAPAQRALLERWVAENPPGTTIGWDPYPTSLRIVNWVKWVLAGHSLPDGCTQSLAVQLRWLERRLERHLLGNHLFANAKALVFGGAFFGEEEGTRWLSRGAAILDEQVPEQILPDGGHFELSPMYHALALEDMLDLHNLLTAYGDAIPEPLRDRAERWSSRVPEMRRWLRTMSHPDGEIAFFNDAAIGIAPAPAELESYAGRLGFRADALPTDDVTVLAQSGYVRVERSDAVLLLDVAPVGPDYIPGHAHADTLSFEMSLGGRRVFVNSGTSRYGSGGERLRQRATAAHNTVIVDDTDSSQVWGGFRVGRRAYPFDLEIDCGDPATVRCSHDGYRRRQGGATHERSWRLERGRLIVEDSVTGSFRLASARYHLHPDVAVSELRTGPEGSGQATLDLPGGGAATFKVRAGQVREEATAWHPAFGRDIPNRCLVVDVVAGRAAVEIKWTGR
jgi:uncharacterized heparinase superfamily protein